MEVEHCIRADGEEIRTFLHRIKKTVDKGWPDDMVGIDFADQNAQRTAQARQTRQRFIDYILKGSDQGICNEKPNNIWWNIQMQLGTIFRPT